MAEFSIIRCVCGNKQPPGWPKKKIPMIQCERCEAWQHNICVGLLESNAALPNQYYCEVCQPKRHGRFRSSAGTDERATIARQRLNMHLVPVARDSADEKERTKWLVIEIMAMVEGHGEDLDVPWCTLNEIGEPWMEEDFHAKMMASMRMVLHNATIQTLETFRARVIKVWFSEAGVAATELHRMKAWLDPEFMAKMENADGREWMEGNADGMEGMEGLGRANAKLVRKYFNLR